MKPANDMVDPAYTIDVRPLRYSEPRTHVARLVQQPSYLIDGCSLANAYMADYRASRRAALEKETRE